MQPHFLKDVCRFVNRSFYTYVSEQRKPISSSVWLHVFCWHTKIHEKTGEIKEPNNESDANQSYSESYMHTKCLNVNLKREKICSDINLMRTQSDSANITKTCIRLFHLIRFIVTTSFPELDHVLCFF